MNALLLGDVHRSEVNKILELLLESASASGTNNFDMDNIQAALVLIGQEFENQQDDKIPRTGAFFIFKKFLQDFFEKEKVKPGGTLLASISGAIWEHTSNEIKNKHEMVLQEVKAKSTKFNKKNSSQQTQDFTQTNNTSSVCPTHGNAYDPIFPGCNPENIMYNDSDLF
ncbi:4760_t:CDS:2 [Dentiscutata heterogama]|uniref:4760_t:CDS:1 n=1 Tax=Dentiscutata heterogama TaxID=1316150 RepID=A0ACA9K7J1_9GLOM|nr:4760_t:CDS:2 [Dentiscutata heterogama]